MPEPTKDVEHGGTTGATEGNFPEKRLLSGSHGPRYGEASVGRRWAGRLAFPMLALAVVLAMQGLRERQSDTLMWGLWTLAAVSAVAGLLLLRSRHRRS